MALCTWKRLTLRALCAGAVGLGLAGGAARADGWLFQRPRAGGCCPLPCPPSYMEAVPAPGTTPTPSPIDTGGAPPPPPPGAPGAPGIAEARQALGGGQVTLLGDILSIPAIAFGSRQTAAGQIIAPAVVPSVRSFKVADNQSPRPLDRIYFDFHYYDSVNEAANRRFGAPLQDARVYREIFGLEKTFFNGRASLGLRLPLNSFAADSSIEQFNGTSTALGDLTVIGKYALYDNRRTGDLLSLGLSVTPPTGPASFAGTNALQVPPHSTVLQPFVGYILNFNRLYFHGFTAVDVPTDGNDVTLIYSDLGAGYFLYRNYGSGRLLTAVVPTVEAHMNVPLNHRGALDFRDPVGAADVLNLTSGMIFGVGRRSTLALGLVTPLTGPRPFAFEALAQLNIRFGRSVAAPAPATTVLGE